MRFLLLISVALATSLFSCQQKQNLLIPDFFSEFLESIKEDINERDYLTADHDGKASELTNKIKKKRTPRKKKEEDSNE